MDSLSFRQHLLRVIPALVLGLTLADCAKQVGSVGIPVPIPTPHTAPVAPLKVDSSGWEVQERTAADGVMSLVQKKMPAAQLERTRNEYRQTSLVAIPMDARFNVQLFKINQVPEWANTVFIAPRIYAYGSAQGGRVAPERHQDGTVSLAFPVILIDGTKSVIDSPSDKTQINLPKSMLVNEPEALKADIAHRLGADQVLAPLPGCPKKLLLKINDREMDVTPSDLERGDYCQFNRPFNVTVRLQENEAHYMLEEALYANAVEIRATFETRVSFVTSKAVVTFDKGKLFRDIEAEIQVNAGAWADVDAHAKVTEIVKNHALKVEIQGDMNPIIQSVAEQAVKAFFEPFTPDPKTGLRACSAAVVCLRLNYNYSKESETFQFSWVQTTTALTGQNYLTWAQLAPLLDKEIVIGGGINAGGDPRPELSTSMTNGLETGLTALPGDLLQITPSYLIKELRDFDIPRTTRVDHNVCVDLRPAYERDVCHSHCARGEGCDKICYKEPVPAQCLRSENQWVDTTTYSYSSPNFAKIDQPIGQMEKIFDGLALRFVWRTASDGVEHELTCALNQFSRKGDGKSLIVRLENRGTCSPFLLDGNIQPMLYLVNHIEYPHTYKEGSEVRMWNGQNPQNPVGKIFYPEVKFAGVVAIRGYSFGSYVSGGQKTQSSN